MKKPFLQHITDFTLNKVVPLVFVGGSLVGIGYFCTYEHRLENIVVQESGPNCGTDYDIGETSCWEELEVSDHWKCLYLTKSHLKPSTKLEYLKWMRGLRFPLLECDMILEYKILGEEKIYK